MVPLHSQDKPSGSTFAVQCFTLNSLVAAALGRKTNSIDLLVLDTAGGEHRILATLEHLNVSVSPARSLDGGHGRNCSEESIMMHSCV